MLLQVSIEVGLLAEASVALVTFERLLLVVDVAHMALQVGRDTERAFTVLALVGLLPSVGAEVPRQVGGAGEDLPAELAGISLLHLVAARAVAVLVGALLHLDDG